MSKLLFAAFILLIGYCPLIGQVTLHSPCRCTYEGTSFLETNGESAAFHNESERSYEYGDSVPSSYESPDVRDKVLQELNRRRQNRLTKMEDMRGYHYPTTDGDLVLEAEFEMHEFPRIAVLQYRADMPSWNRFHVIYVKDAEKVYLIDYVVRESDIDSILVTFNRVVEENPGIFSSSPLCEAFLYLAIGKYGTALPMVVLEKPSDLLAPVAILESLGDRPAPHYLKTLTDLYWVAPSSDTVLSQYISRRSDQNNLRELLDSYRFQDSLEISPPTIVEDDSLFTAQIVVSGRAANRICRYAVEIRKNGTIKKVQKLTRSFDGPVLAATKKLGQCGFPGCRTWFVICD